MFKMWNRSRQQMRAKVALGYAANEMFQRYYYGIEQLPPTRVAKLNSDLYYDDHKLVLTAIEIIDDSICGIEWSDHMEILTAIEVMQGCKQTINKPKVFENNLYMKNKERLVAAIKLQLLEEYVNKPTLN